MAAAHITFNYTAALDIVFIIAAAIFVAVFLRSRGPAMMRMTESSEHGVSDRQH